MVSESKHERVRKALEKLRLRKSKMEAKMAFLQSKFEDDELELVEAS